MRSRHDVGKISGMRLPAFAVLAVALGAALTAADGAIPQQDLPMSRSVDSPLSVMFDPTGRRDSAPAGSAFLLADSATLVIGLPEGDTATWFANAAFSPWIVQLTPSGTGSGTVRWQRDVSGLASGTYVALIRATLSSGEQATLSDTLLVLPPPLVLAASRIGVGISGSGNGVPDSTPVQLRGVGNDTTTWTATHLDNHWLTLTTATGAGSGTMRWMLDAIALRPDVYWDTILVQTSRGDAARTAATFIVTAPPVATACAAQEMLGEACLDPTRRRYLDLTGNHDGTFNLGDFVALLHREGTP